MSVMDLSSNILAFATGTYEVTRADGPGTYDDQGIFVPEDTDPVDVVAMVAPITGRDLLRLPEGLRAKELLAVFTVDALRVEAPGVRPDYVAIDGESWQVEHVERWLELGNFYRSIVSKVHA